MDAMVNREALVDVLKIATHIAHGKGTRVHVAADVYLDTKGDYLQVTATDLTTWGTWRIPAAITEREPALVPAKALLDIIKGMTGENIAIKRASDGYKVTVTDYTASAEIYGHDPDDFPMVPTALQSSGVTLDCNDLRSAVEHTMFAASRDVARQQLCGVAYIDGGVFVGCDGKRLAEYTSSAYGECPTGIIPLTTADVVRRTCKLDQGMIATLRIDTETMSGEIETYSATIRCHLIHGELPDYRSLIPADHPTTIRCTGKALGAAVKTAAAGLPKDKRTILVDVNGQVAIRSSDTETGSAMVPIVGAERDGNDVTVGFDPKYITDVAKILAKDWMSFGLSADRGAAVIRADRFRYAFMPVVRS